MPDPVDVLSVQAARHKAEHIPYIVMRGFGISSIAYFLDALVAGGLVWMAAVSFKQANESSPEQQLPHVFQGLVQIGVMFTQVTTITVCLAVIQSLEAAVRWPDIVIVAAVACAVLAAVRTAAMGLVMAKYTPGSGKGTMALMGMREGKSQHIPWLDKAAITIVGGLLLPFSMPNSNPVSKCSCLASIAARCSALDLLIPFRMSACFSDLPLYKLLIHCVRSVNNINDITE